jgi:hypothetical protein
VVLQGLRELATVEPARFAERADELSYLANVLVAGAQLGGRRLRPIDAVELVLQTVSAGLALCCPPPRDPKQLAHQLQLYPCDGLFRLALARSDDPGVRQLVRTLEV